MIFLGGRLATGALCFVAAGLCLRRAGRYPAQPDRQRRFRIASGVMILIGLLCIAVGFDEAVRRADQPISPLTWISLAVDALVPGFFLYALNSLGIRDDLERRLADAAERDPLTGLPNRAGFRSRALALLAAAGRSDKPVAIAMFDVDRFKRINDGWGHGAGDDVLRGVAQASRDYLRDNDVFARFGGEEFVLLMGGVGPEEALPLVERLRAAIAEAVPHPGAPEFRVTLSAGIASVEGRDFAALEAAAKLADSGLYAAKEGGRDRAVISRPVAA